MWALYVDVWVSVVFCHTPWDKIPAAFHSQILRELLFLHWNPGLWSLDMRLGPLAPPGATFATKISLPILICDMWKGVEGRPFCVYATPTSLDMAFYL